MVQNTLFKVAEVELTYTPNYKPSERPQISTAKQAHEVLITHWSMGKIELITGGVSSTLADPKVIFAIALKSGASGIILCHNHPSEELQPGREDIDLTRKLQQGGRILDIEILDHLIVIKYNFYNFADEGLM